MPSFARAFAPPAFALLAGPAFGQDVTGWGTELALRPARPYVVVAPDYPKAALAKGLEATVDVTGRISKDGVMEEPVFRSSVEDTSFRDAIAEVLKFWLFRSPVDADTCELKGGEAQMRVWYEIAGGKPKVSISMPSADLPAASRTSAPAPETAPLTATRKETPIYPRRLIQKGVKGARVITVSRVGRDGKVQAVAFQNTRAAGLFLLETERALKLWEYDTSRYPLQERPFVCVEHTFDYKLMD